MNSKKTTIPEHIKDLTIIEKGHLHELVEKEKQAYKEDLEKQPWYIEQQKRKEELKEQRKKVKTITKKSSPQNKTKKMFVKKDINFMQEIIKRENIDMKTEEGRQKLLKIVQEMGKNNIY